MKKLSTLLFAISAFCASASAQGLFEPLPKPDVYRISQMNPTSRNYKLIDSVPILKTTPSVTVFRPDVSAVLAYDKNGNSYAMAGVGVSVTGASWDDATSRYVQTYSFGAFAYAKGAATPSGPTDVFAYGISGAYKIYAAGVALSTKGVALFSIGFKVPLAPPN